MSQLSDLTARETEVIRILRVLSAKSTDFVVVGGYAINALTSHRFSVDCDIVTETGKQKEVDSILLAEGYKPSKAKKYKVYGARIKKYVKPVGSREVSVEIFPKELSCRQTEGVWAYPLLKQNSSRRMVVGATGSVESMVPSKELMIAMKVHAGRDTDLRDVAMLSEKVDWAAVKDFALTGNPSKVKKQIAAAITTIGSSNFASSLKAEFALRIDVSPIIRRTLMGLNSLAKSL